jgi:pimeloyl-ACP methyl ester carboxylesterase
MPHPTPIELHLPSDIILRGLEYPQNGPVVVLVHDLGTDLDSWGTTPGTLVGSGFRVVSIELRGHGLSDGEPDAEKTFDDIAAAVATIVARYGPVALVAGGSVATACFGLGADNGTPVQIVVSPLPPELSGVIVPADTPAMRALFVGSEDIEASSYVRSRFPVLPGPHMWFSAHTAARGVDLLAAFPHLVEHMITFLRRYLTAYHLAWIAEHSGRQET